MPFAAMVVEITDADLKELYDGNSFLLEAWAKGKLLFQRGFKHEIRVLNSARQNNTIIFVPDPRDEPEQGKSFIYLVSLGDEIEMDLNKEVDITERKIEDWTNRSQDDYAQMSCMLAKNDVLYVSFENVIHAAKIGSLASGDVASKVLLKESITCKGELLLDTKVSNFRCLCLYDTEKSFNKKDPLPEEAKKVTEVYLKDSVIAIMDNLTRADYINIVCTQSGNELKIRLI